MSLDVYLEQVKPVDVFSANITHNLGDMAKAAGIYEALWRPEEIGITKAHELISILIHGLKILKKSPAKFRKLSPENGWGTYEGLIKFVEKYLAACQEFPEATIRVGR